MSLDTKTTIQISDISCHGLPAVIGLLKKPGKFYIKIIVDNHMHQTPVAPDSNHPAWNDPLLFTLSSAEEIMTIKIYAKRRFHVQDSFMGELIFSLKDPDIMSDINTQNKMITQRLFKKKNNKKIDTNGFIEFILHRIQSKGGTQVESAPQLDAESFRKANEALAKIDSPGRVIGAAGGIMDGISAGAVDVAAVGDLWSPLFEKVGMFIKIVDALADIHPYAAIAWAVLSQPLKAIILQNERDQEIYALLIAMNEIYELVLATEPLKTIEAHRKTTRLMCQQTTECALFIRDYASRSFTKRMIMSPFNGDSSKAALYLDTFTKLKKDFLTESAVITEITVFQILTKTDELLSEVKELSNMQYLNGLPYAKNQAEPEECHPGTRGAVMTEIIQWFAQPLSDTAERVFWLHGVAGCGKSTIAQTIARRLRAQKRCVSFFFDTSRRADAGLKHLFATISRDLSDINNDWKASLIRTIKGSAKAISSSTVKAQFENLIMKPAEDLEGIGPVLIIIDALDESGSREEREALLKALAHIIELPRHFRFLITSRPEPDIVNALGDHVWVRPSRLDRVDQASTDQDIRNFVRHQLSQISSLTDEWTDEWVEEITARSNQLFQWAFTVCKYISGDGLMGRDPLERLQELLASSSYNGLDELYMNILDHVSDFHLGDRTSRRFEAVMGRILSAKEPLSIEGLSALWYSEEDRNQVKNILSPLGSLLRGVSGQKEPVQPLHTSFIDFLQDRKRSGKYWIDPQRQHGMLLQKCLREMKKLLHFNICGLETSYVFNRDISDLHSRVEICIPPHLSYACRFWVDHLRAFTPTDEWCGHLSVFMQRYLLFWLEALSLLSRVDRGLAQLSMLKDWLQSVENCEELKQLVSDSLRFVEVAAPVLRQSTPHLYLSALPFVPRNSALPKAYLSAFPGSIDVEDSDRIRWSSMLLSINTSSKLWSIALSPDGKRIVSGSADETWSMWDIETGNLLIGPISGHTDEIYSVAFSPDGKRVVSGSRDATVRVWDAGTGEQVTDPLVGHSDIVYSVAFSPDGQHIASGSFDKTIRIWDCETGTHVKTLANGHDNPVYSIAYSSDSKYIASGSGDHKVIIWKCETGDTQILSGHTDVVTGVAFSPDGQQLASCSMDKTIVIWSTETGECILDPLTGHTGPIVCIAFSFDNRYIASGSMDCTVRVWDALTGALVAGPFEGHGNTVFPVGFSPDGKHIISGSWDGTIKIWDVDAGRDPMVHTLPPPRGTAPCVCGTRLQPSQRASHSEAIPMRSIQSRSRPTESTSSRALIGYSEAHTDTISCVASSPDGSRVVSGSCDGTVRVWDAKTAMLVAGPFVGKAGRVSAVAFSFDGKRVVSSSGDAAVNIWDLELGDCVVRSFVGDTGQVSAVAFSPHGAIVMLAFKDGSIKVCDVLTGEVMMDSTTGHTAAVTSAAVSADGGLIALGSAEGTAQVWDARTGTAQSFKHDAVVNAVAFSLDGCYVISGSSDGSVRVWDVKTGLGIGDGFCGHSGSVISVAFSPDRTRIASGSVDNRILVWDLDKHNLIFELISHEDSVHSVVFSADGQRIISGSADRSLKIWDSRTGNLLAETVTASMHTDLVASVAFSPDGMRVASGSYDQSLRIWDAKTGRLIGRPFLGHTDIINTVTFSPDGKFIASGSNDETVKIWNVYSDGTVVRSLDVSDRNIARLTFSPDGTLLVSGLGNGDIKLWDTTTWDEKATADHFQGHTRFISSVQFSSDGRRLISSSYDKTVRIWDVKTGSCIAGPFYGHNDWVLSSGISPDGTQFISGSLDNTIMVWQIDLAQDAYDIETDLTKRSPLLARSHPHLDLFTDSSEFEDGWMRGPDNELLFWIPPDYRSSIWRPSNTALIGRMVTRLKLSQFTHGTDWAKCIDETQLIRTSLGSE